MMPRVYLQSKSWSSNLKPMALHETKVKNLNNFPLRNHGLDNAKKPVFINPE